MKTVHVFDIVWDTTDEETSREIDPVEEGLPEEETFDVYDDIDINEQIASKLNDDYGFCVKKFDWEEMTTADQVKAVLRKYFEGNEEYDPNFSAQNAIDEISAIVGM